MINDVLNFLKQNYHDKEIVIFDIGAADLGDSIQYKHEFPNSKVFSFECNNDWLENNIKKSIEHGIYYNHCAISDTIGHLDFYASNTFGEQYWPWSGGLCKPWENSRFTWKSTYKVNTVTLEYFCEKYKICPTYIHMDIQGAELKAMKGIGKYKPKYIQAEICEFQSDYDTGTTYQEWLSYMQSLGYIEVGNFQWDGFYELRKS